MNKKPIMVPIDGHGNQVAHDSKHMIGRLPDELKLTDWRERDSEPEWKTRTREAWIEKARAGRRLVPNWEFTATLTFEHMETGRSAVRFHLRDENGITYVMFGGDVVETLQKGKLRDGGRVFGRWSFIKRGANYGVKLVDSTS